jgi:hypothetical protein
MREDNMSRIKVVLNGVEQTVSEEFQQVWDSVESGDVGFADLGYVEPIEDLIVSEKVQSMAIFLSISKEMLAAQLDDFKYVIGDVDCLDMEEYTNALIVSVEV